MERDRAVCTACRDTAAATRAWLAVDVLSSVKSMFGLLRPRSCSNRAPLRRMQYCGTCKTLGKRYGQRARMLLNHDTVFLAELLTELDGGFENRDPWQPAYRSYNCMSLPEGELPVALDFAAAATMALTEWKVRDHLDDRGGRTWTFANRLFRSPFERASKRLDAWRFPSEELEAALSSQQDRERAPESIEQLAWPTAQATALFCGHGARLIRRFELFDRMDSLGRSFGTLIYLLDAYEDHEKDPQRGEFNALRALGLTREWANRRLRELASEMERSLEELPVSDMFRAEISSRLRINLSLKFGEQLPILHAAPRRSRRERFRARRQSAAQIARDFKSRETAHLQGKCGKWIKGGVVFASVAAVAFVMPQEAGAAASYKECMGLGFNLLAFGSLLAMAAGEVPVPGKKGKFSGCCCADSMPDVCCADCCCGECCCESCECGSCCDSGCCECGGCCDC